MSALTIPVRTLHEWEFHAEHSYAEPFTDLTVDAHFSAPSGETFSVPGYYDGGNTWRVRFNPGEAGSWTYHIVSRPEDPGLSAVGVFEVAPRAYHGFLRATPGAAWGFRYESGEPVLIFGDTTYNLFGMAHCGNDVRGFLRRRKEQGFNLLRIRVPVSPFHPPEGYSQWQTCRTWAWGGSEQSPRFDRFNLDYFRSVDAVMAQIEELDLGVEMIMEAWGFEFPFNSRNIFVTEWEELWLRYLIARYDAYNSLYIWTPLNEYEFYPNGDWHHKPVADRWGMRIARWIKAVGGHGHVVAMHNGPREPAFADRFRADPAAVDAIMYQEWGTRGKDDGWLAAGIEEQFEAAFVGWQGSAVLAEYGYERNPAYPVAFPAHDYCCEEHTRRGAWRGAFSGMGVITGFENSWGPFLNLEEDQPGVAYLLHFKRFFSELVPFHRLQPAQDLLKSEHDRPGRTPRVLAAADHSVIAVYLPAGGDFEIEVPGEAWSTRWFDPRTGELEDAEAQVSEKGARFSAPPGYSEAGHPWDWALLLQTS
jgi:hypothetical protein